jgi:betaine-aldehyde dehydrogenase
MRHYDHFIGGQNYKPSVCRTIERRSPATDKPVASFAEGSKKDAEAAIAAARVAFDDGPWPRLSGVERGRILLRFADLIEASRERLARIETQEVGKPIKYARADIDANVDMTRFAAGMAMQTHGESFTNLGADRTGLVLRDPVGVVGLIIPWNFPAEIFGKKVPYALAAGCTCVVKPSEFTSGSAMELAKLAIEAGVPPGVANVVTGYGDPVGETLTRSADVDFISFTGSTAVGRKIIATSAETVKPVSLELGGKNANIVFADADIDAAIDGVMFGIFLNSGQCCVSGSRLLVQASIADRFMEKLVARSGRLKVGNPEDDDTDIGSMIHSGHFDKVVGYVHAAQAQGATLLTGGAQPSAAGNFIAPTIFDHVAPTMNIFREEVFGPVLSTTRFETAEQAISLGNQSTYGLANSVWSSDANTLMTVSRRLRSGLVWANTTLEVAPQLPFGGVRSSGYGRETGEEGFNAFTVLKTLVINSGNRANIYSV